MSQQRAVPAHIPVPAPAHLGQGIWSLPVPLPGNSLRFVIPYALEVPGGLVLIDAGWDDDEPWNALVAGLATMGATPSDVRGVLVTHAHPDHYGLAPRLREISSAWVALHPADRHMLAADRAEADQRFADSSRWLLRMGASAQEIETWSAVEQLALSMMLAGLPDRDLAHGEVVADVPGFELTTLHTPGHTDGHVCFLDRGREVLFSGDHVLAKISPNVSTMTSLLSNPLGVYLSSLRATGDLGIDQALPAHVEPIAKLRERVTELLAHHEQRLAEMLETLSTESGLTTYDVASRQPWKRGWEGLGDQMRRSAVGETHAHLIELGERRLVVQHADGPVLRWSAVQDGVPDGSR
ncbi:MAG: MBL fold metallo-hydrolase [Pseudonocardiales bacterium]|nr:MBL fold metallo-hydrolase [Pseudonocardiales bacterium]